MTEPKLLKVALQIIADAPVKMHMQSSKAAEILQYIEQLEGAVEAERERWKTAVGKYVRPKYLADSVIRDMENCNSNATETKNT